MRKLSLKIALFFLPILIVGIGFEVLLRKIPNDYSYKKEYLDRNSNKIKVLFLGSSHAYYDINPVFMKCKSFNAGYVSQSLNYDYKILRKYDHRWDSLKYLVIAVDYVSLFDKLETGPEAWRVKNYKIYYEMSNSGNLPENSELLSNDLKVNLSRLNYYWLKGRSPVTCSLLGWGTDFNSENNLDLGSTGISAAKRHLSKTDQNLKGNIDILKSIIEFAKANKVKVVLFTPPCYRTYVKNLDHNQLIETTNTLVTLANSYSNTSYFNWLEDRLFTVDDFHDADHLNEKGARKLTVRFSSLF